MPIFRSGLLSLPTGLIPAEGYCKSVPPSQLPDSLTWYTDDTMATKVLETLMTYDEENRLLTVLVKRYAGGVLQYPLYLDTIVYDAESGYEDHRSRAKVTQ